MSKIMFALKIQVFIIVLLFLFIIACSGNKKIVKNNKNTSANKESLIENKNKLSSKDKALKEKYAQLLGVDEKNIENLKLYYFIDDWMGVPYKYGGKDKSGIDCSGFTGLLYKEVYNKNISGPTSTLIELTNIIPESELKEGDMVFFQIEKKGKVSHVGVYLQNNKFVHATTKKGVMINDLSETYYRQHYFKSGRVK
ncbi:MAG: C40 family peptidase [Bacteroidia bacterium]